VSYDVHALRAREFPWAAQGEATFLNAASTGPLPQRTLDALRLFNEQRAQPGRLTDARLAHTFQRARELVARFVGASPHEIALATNTSHGLNLAALALPLAPGDVVLTPDHEFPANVYPWMAAAERRGIEYRRLRCDDAELDERALLRALDAPGVRALSLSWVSFATGQRLDLATIGRACRERGIWFVVDAIQGLGALPLDLAELQVDVLACGAQKWLLSPWGSGFVYVREGLLREVEPPVVSWLAVRGADDYSRLLDYEYAFRDDARRFEFATLPYQDFVGMTASLELLFELGPCDVAEHIASLADRIVDWASSRPDVRLLTPSDRACRAGIVSFVPPAAAEVSARLREAGVVHSLREGAIRLAPHCYNTSEEIDRALAIVDE
jgi:selenocysteine lyase/cysteine desulfurase